MNKKELIDAFLQKLGVFGKKLGNLIIVAIAMLSGFFIGYYYCFYYNLIM